MGTFTYKDNNWKVFSNVNNGTVLNALKTKEEHRNKLFNFLHNTLGIMNFTSKSGQIFYEIKETDLGYSMLINWESTKLKSETIKSYLELLKSQTSPIDVNTEWRLAILKYLTNLVNSCKIIEYDFIVEAKEYKATLMSEITYENLYSPPKTEDKIEENFNYSVQTYPFPYELIEDFVIEDIQEALNYFGNDHQMLLETLKPYEGKEFVADFLIGATYYLYLDLPNKAYSYLKRALNISDKYNIQTPPLLLDFIGSIELSTNKNPIEAEHNFIKSLVVGNEQGFLKLAYLYLQQGRNDKKEKALSFAQIGEKILPHDEDENHRIAGYHIVASVYLWNRKFSLAEQVHGNFLSNQNWCNSYFDLVRGYLLLSLALNDSNFIANLALDYPFLRERFSVIFDCWHFKTINPYDKRFKGDFIETLKLLEKTKEIYDIKQ